MLTQGSQIWFVDPADNSVVEIACPTSITGIDASRDQIEDTCLNGNSRTFRSGLPSPGAAQIGVNFDATEESHIRLHELFVSGAELQFAVGFEDGTAAPTADTAGEFVLPATRTYLSFPGFVSSFPFDFALNSVVASNLTVQLADFPELSPKA